jgi:hypothetical protein
MKLLTFSNYIAESNEPDRANSETFDRINSTLAELTYFVSIGILRDSEFKKQITQLTKELFNYHRGIVSSPSRYMEDLIKLGDTTGLAVLTALGSEGTKALIANGLYLVSSFTQLANGSLIFSVDQNYRRSDGWGIGFFPGPRIIRRMTPKGINIGVWSRTYGSMDILIKKFKDAGSDLEFYNTAMLWAADNIDFETAKKFPENHIWKYYKKKKGSTGANRTESDNLRVEADALDSNNNIHPYQSGPDRAAALEAHLKAWKLRLKACELDNNGKAADRSAIDGAKSRIYDIEQDIVNHKNRNTV